LNKHTKNVINLNQNIVWQATQIKILINDKKLSNNSKNLFSFGCVTCTRYCIAFAYSLFSQRPISASETKFLFSDFSFLKNAYTSHWSKNLILCSVTDVFKVHPQCMWHGHTVKQLGLLTNGNQINWINFKKKSQCAHKEINKEERYIRVPRLSDTRY